MKGCLKQLNINDTMKQPFVILIILNYNGAKIKYKNKSILWWCFTTLKKTNYTNYKIILADDSSTDNSIQYIRTKFPYVEIVKNKKNMNLIDDSSRNKLNGSWSGNCNNALKHALVYKPDYIVLLNNDIIITDKNWLRNLVLLAESDKKIGVESCKLVYPNGRIQHAGCYINIMPRNIGRGEVDRGQYNKIEEKDFVTFSCVLIKNTVFNKIGILNVGFYEEVDYLIRAKMAGFKIIYNGAVSVIHLESFSSLSSPNKLIKDISFYPNQVHYAYFLLNYLKGIKFWKALFILFIGSIITIQDENKIRKINNIKLKDRLLWRIYMTIKALFEGYKEYKKQNK